MKHVSKKFFLACILLILALLFSSAAPKASLAQTPTDTPVPTPTPDNSGQIKDLENTINDLQSKISNLQGQERTLSSQIAVFDSQIKLTELRIAQTKQQLAQLSADIDTASKKITTLTNSLQDLTKILLNKIVETYEVGNVQPMQVFLSAGSVSDLFRRANYLRIAQAHDKELIYATQQAKNDYANQKTIFEDKKKKIEVLKTQLEAYNQQIDQEKAAKQALLTQTQGNESTYQKLLSQAQAQISAFKSFASFQGGAKILPAQPSPDGWYYNQRDERWGNNAIGASSDQVWDVGCLITSTAMVLKKHGTSVTPANVASNSSYFFSSTAYMLLPWLGGKLSSTWGYDQGTVDNKLAAGEPVIVGLRAGAYGMHFVVLKSGSGGSYVMNDPWNGPDLKFSDYYSTAQIFQYGFYNG